MLATRGARKGVLRLLHHLRKRGKQRRAGCAESPCKSAWPVKDNQAASRHYQDSFAPMKKLQINKVIQRILSLQTADVVSIPLRDGRWAYARIFQGANLGVVRCLGSEILVPGLIAGQPMAFHAVFFCTPKQREDLDWIYLGQMPFLPNEADWAPPSFSEDVASPGHFRIHHQGKITPATKEQVKGLDKAVMSSPASIRKRILESCENWPRV